MLDKIRKFDIKKAGIGACIIGGVNILVHLLVIFEIIPYTWTNGGRTENLNAARELATSSIIMTVINIFIALVASKLIPLKMKRGVGIVLSVFLIATLPLTLVGVVQQFLGTVFEKCIMSIVTLVGFCLDIRIAFEKRW